MAIYNKILLVFTLGLTLVCASGLFSFAQSTTDFVKAKFKGDLEKYLVSNLWNGKGGLSYKNNGYSVLQVRITEKGNVEYLNLEKTPRKQLGDRLIELILMVKDNWEPTRINDKPVSKMYKIIVKSKVKFNSKDFADSSRGLFEKCKKKMSKKDYERALKLINNAINLDPYEIEYYERRSEIYKCLGNDIKSKEDQKHAEMLDRDILLNTRYIIYTEAANM